MNIAYKSLTDGAIIPCEGLCGCPGAIGGAGELLRASLAGINGLAA